jgi:hypothetical protein
LADSAKLMGDAINLSIRRQGNQGCGNQWHYLDFVKHDNPTNSTEKLLLNGNALKHYGVPASLSFYWRNFVKKRNLKIEYLKLKWF